MKINNAATGVKDWYAAISVYVFHIPFFFNCFAARAVFLNADTLVQGFSTVRPGVAQRVPQGCRLKL